MKRMISLCCAGLMAFSLAACGSQNAASSSTSTPQVTSAVVGKITALDGTTVTLQLGELTENQPGDPPSQDGAQPSGDNASGDSSASGQTQTSPEKTEGDNNTQGTGDGSSSTDAQNEAPVPPLVEARVLSNSITRIPIKLAGVDPNGDSVRLLGLGSGPALGRVVEIGDGWIRYEAYPDSRGTDTFRYQVIDSLGAIGTGEIRIGVAPPSDDNAAPIGVPDEISVRPGRSLATIVEIAARNWRLKAEGYDAVAELDRRLQNHYNRMAD